MSLAVIISKDMTTLTGSDCTRRPGGSVMCAGSHRVDDFVKHQRHHDVWLDADLSAAVQLRQHLIGSHVSV